MYGLRSAWPARRLVAIGVLGLMALSACGGSGESDTEGGAQTSQSRADDSAVSVSNALSRFGEIQEAVDDWASAETLADAKAAAERARNLVTGPDTLGAGDLDGDDKAVGLSPDGLLPGANGTPGLVSDLSGCDAVERDVLGGDWAEPSDRWDVLDAAIMEWRPSNNTFPSLPSHPQRIVGWASLTLASNSLDDAVERDVLGGDWAEPSDRWDVLDAAIMEWRPSNNTFPSLPSHPQRIVGWASLTLASNSLDDAHEYSGHAQLHVDVSRAALDGCS